MAKGKALPIRVPGDRMPKPVPAAPVAPVPVDPPWFDPALDMDARVLRLEYFGEYMLGERDYQWQFNVLKDLGRRGSRVLVAASNGSGKTSKVAARAVVWHMIRFPGSLVVVTAGVYRQVAKALWPSIRTITNGLGGETLGWRVTEDGVTLDRPEGMSRCVGFSVSDPNKAEGWHRQGKHDNLLYIIDEAKAVPDGVFEAMERCQPSRLLIMSSPGGPFGAFYRFWNTGGPEWSKHRVTAYDCPHLTREWIDLQIKTYGEGSPLVRSMIFAEFAEDGNEALVLPPSVLQRAIASPPKAEKGQVTAGCDFAAGGDENVLVVRDGNEVKAIIAWKEKNTMSAVGRFVTEFRRFALREDNIFADAGGLGIPMCDALREAGWSIRRVNNGDKPGDPDKFANRGVEMWVRYARLVESGKVIVPADEQLHRQLTTRRLEYNSRGKLSLESKDQMRERGLESPDRADAVVLAFCGGGHWGEDFGAVNGFERQESALASLADYMDDGSVAPDGCRVGW